MISVSAVASELTTLGGRLRDARLARDESMRVFAERIGVSIPTLRAMEQGSASVQVGSWGNALGALGRLADLSAVLANSESPLDRVRAPSTEKRRRASRQHA